MTRFIKLGVLALVPLVILAMTASWFLSRANKNTTSFRTVPVKRGDLVATISATGTVEPEEVVDVGAQVAGQNPRLRQGRLRQDRRLRLAR